MHGFQVAGCIYKAIIRAGQAEDNKDSHAERPEAGPSGIASAAVAQQDDDGGAGQDATAGQELEPMSMVRPYLMFA